MDVLDQRISTCRRLLAQNPNSTIFASLADVYRKKGMLDKAHKICEAGLKVHSHYGLAHLVMAKISLDMNLLDEAEYEVDWVDNHDLPQGTVSLLRASLLLKRGRINQAKEMLKELSLSQPGNAGFITANGKICSGYASTALATSRFPSIQSFASIEVIE